MKIPMIASFPYPKFVVLVIALFAMTAAAQTSSFTYQGRLTDLMLAANGPYDLQFSLFDSGGSQIGLTQTITSVPVTAGIFTVELDFGASAFTGEERFLEIAIKKPADPDYTVLTPRQRMTSSPYALKSLLSSAAENASQLGGVPASEFVQDSDPRMTDSRDPNPGSGNYIQNGIGTQPSANFNISGTGRAVIVDATSQFNLNGSRILDASSTSTTVGIGSGGVSTGGSNSFFGFSAGELNTTGSSNAYFGTSAGASNTIGSSNSFFGQGAGFSNVSTGLNSFFGYEAGFSNVAAGNSFFGYRSGYSNTLGTGNTFIGMLAGENNVASNNTIVGVRAGRNNGNSGSTFFGYEAGLSNTTGFQNSFFGLNAGRSTTTTGFNAFFGAHAGADNTGAGNSFFGALAGANNLAAGNNSFFGQIAGAVNTTGSDNSFFGALAGSENISGFRNSFFGSFAGIANVSGSGNAFFGFRAGSRTEVGTNTFLGSFAGEANVSGTSNTYVGYDAGNVANGSHNTFIGADAGAGPGVNNAIAIGSGVAALASFTAVIGTPLMVVRIPGELQLENMDGEGGVPLCLSPRSRVTLCSPPLALNQHTASSSQETKINSGSTENEAQTIDLTSMLHSLRVHREMIENQQRQIDSQKILIDELRALICSQNTLDTICRSKEGDGAQQ